MDATGAVGDLFAAVGDQHNLTNDDNEVDPTLVRWIRFTDAGGRMPRRRVSGGRLPGHQDLLGERVRHDAGRGQRDREHSAALPVHHPQPVPHVAHLLHDVSGLLRHFRVLQLHIPHVAARDQRVLPGDFCS